VAACRVYCVSRIVFGMSLAMDVRCATYSVRQSHAIRRTQYTRHAATAPTHTIHKTRYHSTNSHNTQDTLPQHQLTQYTRHAATAPTQRNDVNN